MIEIFSFRCFLSCPKQQNKVAQEQNGRMIRYLQSRLNDLRNENLSLRERFKTSTSMLHETTNANNSNGLFDDLITNVTPTCVEAAHEARPCCGDRRAAMSGADSGNGGGGRGIDIDEDEASLSVEYTDEMLQQKIKDLQSLQIQLNNVKA